MTLTQPWWALLIVPLLLVAWARERQLEGSSGRRRARLLVRGLLLGLLGLALAQPSVTWSEHPAKRWVVALDRSEAMSAAGRAEARRLLEERLNASGDDEAPALALGFAAQATGPFDLRAALAAGWPAATSVAPPTLEPEPAATSRVVPALAAARAAFGPNSSGRVLLLVSAATGLEGLETLADELAQASIALEARVLPAPRAAGPLPARVRRLSVPTGSVRGAFEVRADIEGPPGQSALLLADGRVLAGAPVPDAPAAGGAGTTRELFFDGLELPPGRHLLALTLVPSADAPATEPPELALAEVQVEERPRVVMLLADPERDPLRRAASAQGFDVEALAPSDLGARLAGGAAGFHVLALDAPSALRLDTEVQRRVALLVENGLGLFLAAGEDPQAWAALAGTPLGTLLPLEPLAPLPPPPPTPRPPPPTAPPPPDEPEPAPGPGLKAERQPEEALPISLLLVLDRSASMQGMAWAMAVEAAARAAQVLSPFDRVGVVTFAEEARIELAMGPVLTAGSVALHLPAEAQGRGTNLVAALRKAAEVMQREHAPIRHVLLLTDGFHNPTGTHAEQALWSEVVKPLARLGVTLTVVGLGEGHDATTLKQIRQWVPSSHYRAANRPSEVPTIFIVDTQGLSVARSKEARARLPDPDARPIPPVPTPKAPVPEPAAPPPPAPSPEPATPAPPAPGPPPEPPEARLLALRLGTPHPALKGFLAADLPKVEAPLRAGPRLAGVVVLERGPLEPVLGARRFGLGRVLAWLGRPRDPWLATWPELARLYGQSLRSLLPPEGTFEQQLRPRVLATPRGDRLELAGLLPPAAGPLTVAWRSEALVQDLGRIDPTQPGEGIELPSAPRGSVAHVTLTDAQGRLAGALTYVAGTAQGPPDAEAARAELARRLAGRVPSAAALVERQVALARWLLLLALLLLPLDAWLHRRSPVA